MRYVITPDIAIELVERGVALTPGTKLVAPTLLRSQVLTILYQRVQRGEMSPADANILLDDIRRLKMRLLGDRVLQAQAWSIAAKLGWPDTHDAEYVALTGLQADAFVTGDVALADAVRHLVTVAPIDDLVGC